MKHVFTIDSDVGEVTHDVDGHSTKPISLRKFLSNFNYKTINLGLLPPVVKFISPVDSDGRVVVIVEQKPGKRQIVYQQTAYDLTLPWHSFIFTFIVRGKDEHLIKSSALLFFHAQEVRNTADYDSSFLCLPYIPNVYATFEPRVDFTNMCHGPLPTNSFPSTQFMSWFEGFAENWWGTGFNSELDEALSLYYSIWCKNEYAGVTPGLTTHFEIMPHMLNVIGKLSFAEACGRLITMDEMYIGALDRKSVV